MIWGSRRSLLDALAAAVGTAYIHDTNHRVHAYELAGVIDDSSLHRPVFPAQHQLSARPALSVLLSGRQLLRLGAERRWLEPGDGYVLPAGAAFGWRIEGDARGISCAWDCDSQPQPRFFRVDDLDSLRATTQRLHAGADPDDAEEAHRQVLAALGEVEPVLATLARTPCTAEHQALCRAIDERLSDLAAEPMQVELQDELGISERSLRRLTTEMFQRYGFVDTNWGEARIRRRLTAAVAFMSHPDATVAAVARAVGYHSTQAMARAFARAGFPPPARVRQVLADLAST